jgi:hypothetical protein
MHFFYNKQPPWISTQFHPLQQIWPPQHSVCQHLCSDLNLLRILHFK